MNTTQLLKLFRAEVRDEAVPYLWSDLEVYGYMSEAQSMFCRLTGGIPDAGIPIVVPAGGGYFPLPAFLLKIKSVNVPAIRRELRVINYEDLQYRAEYSRWQHATPTDPTDIIIGDLDGFAKLFPDNPEPVTLSIIGFRLPKELVLAAGMDLEIRPEHHRSLLYWMKHLAFSKADAETFDRDKAAENGEAFTRYCELARMEQERRAHKPRTVAYGGI